MNGYYIFTALGKFVLMLLALITLTSVAYANGGDLLPPFPVIDSASSKQEAKAMATDHSGSVILVGYGNAGGMNNNYHVVKFKSDGSGVAWRASFDKSGGDDQATAVAVDSFDNVIVTGTVWNGSNTDIHTIKYNGADGTVIWQDTWSGSAGAADIATAIAVDSSNNIYVAGYSANTSGNDDYLIIKYSSAGSAPVWQEIYNSSFNSNDRVFSIAAGVDGIAVTGVSSKGGMDFDILTRKYSFDKILVWEQRKASVSGGDDRGKVVRFDYAGNLIVSGYLYNGQNNDIYTAKYSSEAPGNLLWENSFTGAGNEEPLALWIDANGEVYVTGHTYTYSGNEDVYTARFASTDGARVWEKLYDSGSDFTDIGVFLVGSSGVDGDIFVTGYTATDINEKFSSLKYKKRNGELIWQKSYSSVPGKSARPVGISLLPSGNPVVAGWTDTAVNSYDFVVATYDSGRLDPPTALAAVATSNSSISMTWHDNSTNETLFKIERKLGESGTYAEIATVEAGVTTFSDSNLMPNSYYFYRVRAYSPEENNSYFSNEAHALTKVVSYEPLAWTYQFNGDDNREDEAVGIVIGNDNHPLVTGFSDLTEEGVAGAFSFDYLTIKLDRVDGSVKWKARYDSGDGGTDIAAGIALDNNGDAIVTGTAYLSGDSEKSDDLYTIKYSSAGHTDPATSPAVLWGGQYGTQSGIDQATAIQAAKDSSNNIVVIGHGTNASNDEDMFVIKYKPDGVTPWVPIVYDGPAHGNDYPSAVAFDKVGNIFITGSTENIAGNFDIFTAKYNGETGALIWSETLAGEGNGDDHGVSLAVDGDGDVYVTGYTVNVSGREEWITIKYDGSDVSTDRELWRALHSGMAGTATGDHAVSVALDPISGEVIVAGTSFRTAADSDFHLIRYNAGDGSIIWERNFDRPARYDYLTAMAVDSSGYIYLAGNSRGGVETDSTFDPGSDALALIYDFEGTFLSASEYNGPNMDEVRAITANNQGEAFIAGITRNASNPDYLVVKQKNDYILVPAPMLPVAQADSSKINVTWQNNTPGTSFKLERTTAPVLPDSVWVPIATAQSGTTAFLDSGLSPGTGYCYRIYAYSGSLNSRIIVTCATTTLVAPELNSIEADSSTQITLNWTQVIGNSGYRVERKVANGTWTQVATKDANTTAHVDVGLTPGVQYVYRVSTLTSAGGSLPSNELSIFSRPAAPTLAAPTNITNSQMLLSWSSVTGASVYTLQYRLAGGSYADVPACSGVGANSCVAAGLTPSASYQFQVKATNSGGDSVWSTQVTASAELAVPFLRTISSSTSTTMNLSWTYSSVPGANITSFIVEAKISAAGTYSTTSCPQNTATSCALSGLTPNRNYIFRVKARNAFGDSAWSTEEQYWTATSPPEFTGLTFPAANSATLVWSAVPETETYNIFRSTCAYSDSDPVTCRGNELHTSSNQEYGDWGLVGSVPVGTTTYTDSSLHAGTNYRYHVTSNNAANPKVTNSAVLNGWTLMSPPVLSVVPSSTTALNLSWDQQPGETNYTVEVSASGISGPFSAIAAATALPMNTVVFTHSGLALGSEYCYRVKSYSTDVALPAAVYSNTVCRTTPPNAPALSVATNQYESAFTVLEDAARYLTLQDQLMGRPVVVTSGLNTYTRSIAGNTNTALYVTPPFTTETINQGDSYVVLQTVTGKATGNDSNSPGNSLLDADKNWGWNEWVGYKVKILSSANAVNVGVIRTLAWANAQINVYASEAFPVPVSAGDIYQIALHFGTATGVGSSDTQLIDSSKSWGAADWSGYYLMVTSGANSGHARKIITCTETSLTTDPFPKKLSSGDTYLIAPVARVVPYIGTATGSGSSATQLVDVAHTWQINYAGYYLLMTSGANNRQMRLITSGFDSGGRVTVSPAFENAISSGDTYQIIPSVQAAAYFGTAAGSTGTSTTDLVDNNNSWLSDWSKGYFLMMTSGNNRGQIRNISGKAGAVITVATPFPYPVNPADTYLIGLLAAAYGGGTVTKTISPGLTGNGSSKLSMTNDRAEFKSVAPGYGNNFNYELLALKDLSQLTADYSAQFDYTVTSGLIADDASLGYKYLNTSYVSARLDFQSPAGKTYNTYLQRGRMAPQDTGKSTGFSPGFDVIYDSRTMPGSAVLWKAWGSDQWKDYYLQMTSGANNQRVRKITTNSANGITLESPFPGTSAVGDTYRINAIAGTAAVNGNTQSGKNSTNQMLVDSSDTIGSSLPYKDWVTNQWAGFYLYISSGPNIGQFRTIQSNTSNTITLLTPFPYQIASGDSYNILDPRAAAQVGEVYWITIYNPVSGTNEQLIIPTNDVSGKLKIAKVGNSIQYSTSQADGVWQLRRQLDLGAADLYTPSLFWIYQIARLPHTAGTTENTAVHDFQLTANPPATINLSFTAFAPEVGHNFRRADGLPLMTASPQEISWNRIDAALFYEVERCQSADLNDPWSRAIGSCLTFMQAQAAEGETRLVNTESSTGLTAGYTYRFRVRAKFNSTDYTAWSEGQWYSVTPPAPAVYTPDPGTATAGQLTLVWQNVYGDNGYKIFWKERSGADCTAGEWNGPIRTAMNLTSYTISGLTSGTHHCFRVAAAGLYTTSDSDLSTTVSQSTRPTAPDLNQLTGVTAEKVDLSWNSVIGNSGYKIERKTGVAGTWAVIATPVTGAISYSDTSVASGTDYYYRISANGFSGYSDPSIARSTMTAPSPATIIATAVSASKVSLSWPLVRGADGYKIIRRQGGSGYTQIDNMIAPFSQLYCGNTFSTVGCLSLTPVNASYQNSALAANTLYCYQLISWNSTGGDGAVSNEQCVTTLHVAEQSLSVMAINSFKVRLDWEQNVCTPVPCNPPDGYEIERMVRDGNWVKIATVPSDVRTFVDRRSIDPIRQYKYRIRSYIGDSRSPYSPEITVYTPPYTPGDNVAP